MKIVHEISCTKVTSDGRGIFVMATLFAMSMREEHAEYDSSAMAISTLILSMLLGTA